MDGSPTRLELGGSPAEGQGRGQRKARAATPLAVGVWQHGSTAIPTPCALPGRRRITTAGLGGGAGVQQARAAGRAQQDSSGAWSANGTGMASRGAWSSRQACTRAIVSLRPLSDSPLSDLWTRRFQCSGYPGAPSRFRPCDGLFAVVPTCESPLG